MLNSQKSSFEESVEKMSKLEVAELMSKLQAKIDSGRHTLADVQKLRILVVWFVDKFENKN